MHTEHTCILSIHKCECMHTYMHATEGERSKCKRQWQDDGKKATGRPKLAKPWRQKAQLRMEHISLPGARRHNPLQGCPGCAQPQQRQGAAVSGGSKRPARSTAAFPLRSVANKQAAHRLETATVWPVRAAERATYAQARRQTKGGTETCHQPQSPLSAAPGLCQVNDASIAG